MGDPTYRFRTSLSGFHKGDVTAYIEKSATQHRTQLLEYERRISELQEENRSLQQQLNLLMMATPVSAPVSAPVEEQVYAPAPEPVYAPAPEPVYAPAPEPMYAPVPEPMYAPAPVQTTPAEVADMMQLELQAYRRAEAVERHANIRAKELYEKMETLCGCTLGDFQAADEAVKQAIAVMTAQAASLETACQALSAALNASREKLSAVNMGYDVPDQVD